MSYTLCDLKSKYFKCNFTVLAEEKEIDGRSFFEISKESIMEIMMEKVPAIYKKDRNRFEWSLKKVCHDPNRASFICIMHDTTDREISYTSIEFREDYISSKQMLQSAMDGAIYGALIQFLRLEHADVRNGSIIVKNILKQDCDSKERKKNYEN